ncbi:unnamed protein product [Didymodactylos carnosus]|uniref:BEN domain-containing protein n=1 Tax=Didymodactylos carnosus TaxID=1234261 RepID=A0A8S2Q031_9BILA|nr:unnamed protein product [Didymodactylos carnosus]CAF4080115.1 unnamed protein product [Didymodactylos carnosus]
MAHSLNVQEQLALTEVQQTISWRRHRSKKELKRRKERRKQQEQQQQAYVTDEVSDENSEASDRKVGSFFGMDWAAVSPAVRSVVINPQEVKAELNDFSDSSLSNQFFDESSESESEDIDPRWTDDVVRSKLKSIHPYTNLSTFDFCLQFLATARASLLDKSTITRLLLFMSKTFPHPNNVPRSFENLRKIVPIRASFSKSVVCSLCWTELVTQNFCPCSAKRKLENVQEVYTIDVKKELSSVVQKAWPSIFDYEAKSENSPELCGRDIVTGRAYQEILKKKTNHTLTLFFSGDGVPLCVSNSKAAWIFSAGIVEIPPTFRYSFQNMLLLQFSIGLEKPNVKVTLDSTIAQLLHLRQHGLTLFLNHQQTKFDIHFLFFTADSPALSLFSNFISSAGLSSCYICENHGVYDFQLKKVVYKAVDNPLRTLRQYYQDASSAAEKRRQSRAKKDPTCQGVKGFSVLEPLFPRRLIHCLRPDYMHSTIKCVFDSMLTIVLQTLPKNIVDVIDNRLLSVCLPHDFSRKLRSLTYRNYYKANESRTLLLYVFLPCLVGQIDIELFARICLFVCGIRLVHGDTLVLDNSNALADNFFSLFVLSNDDELSGLANLSLHIHTHYGFLTNQFGSVNATSCFPFEGFLRLFIRNKHGTTYFGDQLSLYHDIDRYLSSVDDTLFTSPDPLTVQPLDVFVDDCLEQQIAQFQILIIRLMINHLSSEALPPRSNRGQTNKYAEQSILSTSSSSSNIYCLVHFPEEQMYTSILKSKITAATDMKNVGTINYQGQKHLVVILHEGTQKQMEKRAKLFEPVMATTNDEDEALDENQLENNEPTSEKRKSHDQSTCVYPDDRTTSKRRKMLDKTNEMLSGDKNRSVRPNQCDTEHEDQITTAREPDKQLGGLHSDSSEQEEETQLSTSPPPPFIGTLSTITTTSINQQNRGQQSTSGSGSSEESSSEDEEDDVDHHPPSREETENRQHPAVFTEKKRKIKQSFVDTQSTKRICDQLRGLRKSIHILIQNQTTKNHQHIEEQPLICDGINLFEIPGSTPMEFARNIFAELFTVEEMKNKKLPGNKKLRKLDLVQLNEQRLDVDKITALKSAIREKFELRPSVFADLWKKTIYKKLSQICIDKRNK